jgi:hypothetical protein
MRGFPEVGWTDVAYSWTFDDVHPFHHSTMHIGTSKTRAKETGHYVVRVKRMAGDVTSLACTLRQGGSAKKRWVQV